MRRSNLRASSGRPRRAAGTIRYIRRPSPPPNRWSSRLHVSAGIYFLRLFRPTRDDSVLVYVSLTALVSQYLALRPSGGDFRTNSARGCKFRTRSNCTGMHALMQMYSSWKIGLRSSLRHLRCAAFTDGKLRMNTLLNMYRIPYGVGAVGARAPTQINGTNYCERLEHLAPS